MINEGVIVTPDIHVSKIKNDMKINAQIAMAFMEFCKQDNPSINHKILICCSDSGNVGDLEDELNRNGCKVFSTCAARGARLNYNGEDEASAAISTTYLPTVSSRRSIPTMATALSSTSSNSVLESTSRRSPTASSRTTRRG